jgi:hypothetical protein
LVLPLRRLRLNKELKSTSVLGSRVAPVLLDRIPELSQSLFVRVTVLNDERLNSLRLKKSQPVPNRSPIIHDIDGEFPDP